MDYNFSSTKKENLDNYNNQKNGINPHKNKFFNTFRKKKGELTENNNIKEKISNNIKKNKEVNNKKINLLREKRPIKINNEKISKEINSQLNKIKIKNSNDYKKSQNTNNFNNKNIIQKEEKPYNLYNNSIKLNNTNKIKKNFIQTNNKETNSNTYKKLEQENFKKNFPDKKLTEKLIIINRHRWEEYNEKNKNTKSINLLDKKGNNQGKNFINKKEKTKENNLKKNKILIKKKEEITAINKKDEKNKVIIKKKENKYEKKHNKFVEIKIENPINNFKIMKIKKKDYIIVKDKKIEISGNNRIFKNLNKKNDISFEIIDEKDNHKESNKIIDKVIELSIEEVKNKNNNKNYDYINGNINNENDVKIKNEINYKEESIQKNSQYKYIKEKNNIIIDQKEFEKKKNEKYLKKLNKIYGFKNRGNNCYLNSSLQLLSRIDDLKEKILNCEIDNDNITNGKLTKEFKNILNQIEDTKDDNLIISPEKLKKIMGNIDDRYLKNSQEDANEFISLFLNALITETANKNKVIDKMKVYDEKDKGSFDKFYKKFYIKKGYSFILELFYGIIRTEKYCKSCNTSNFVKFSSFNMLDLPIYNLVKSNRNKQLDLREILNKYISEYKNDDYTCISCNKNNIYTNTALYTLPKYLIIFFARIVDDEYLDNYIEYPEEFNFNEYIDNKIKIKNNYNYKLECVIEHSGGIQYGHYTALCPITLNCWYRFSDENGYKHKYGYKSNNAIILLYKAQ